MFFPLPIRLRDGRDFHAIPVVNGLLVVLNVLVFWIIRWDWFEIRAWWGLFFVPLLEFWGLFWSGWNWTNLAHLFGLMCGVGVVLLLPTRISMNRTTRSAYSGA